MQGISTNLLTRKKKAFPTANSMCCLAAENRTANAIGHKIGFSNNKGWKGTLNPAVTCRATSGGCIFIYLYIYVLKKNNKKKLSGMSFFGYTQSPNLRFGFQLCKSAPLEHSSSTHSHAHTAASSLTSGANSHRLGKLPPLPEQQNYQALG